MTACDMSTETCVSAGSSPPNCANTFAKTDEEGNECHHHADREDDHKRRVDHRRADLAAQGGVLLELIGDTHQRVLEHASRLPRLHHRDEQLVEDLRVARHRRAEREPRLDILADRHDRFFQDLLSVCASST